jgi:hypothetical protein
VIPKVIHYCWFGKNNMKELNEKCLDSWKRYLPDYKMVLWNEDNFDINSSLYTKEAYECKKYAFVSDYVRLYALYNYGGVYMDADVEVIKPIDCFLVHSAFSGFEVPDYIPTGIMGAEKAHPWIKSFLDYYYERSFFTKDGNMDLLSNVYFMSQISKDEYGWQKGNGYQILKEDVHIYPNDYFCPKVWGTDIINKTENTYTIHHFSATWTK